MEGLWSVNRKVGVAELVTITVQGKWLSRKSIGGGFQVPYGVRELLDSAQCVSHLVGLQRFS